MSEMPLDEALAKADQFSARDKDVPSVSRTLAAEVRRLNAAWDSAFQQAMENGSRAQDARAAVRTRCIRCGADWNNGQLSISKGRIEQLRDIARRQNEWETVTLCDLALMSKDSSS